MRALIGDINDSCYMQFNVELQGMSTSGVWTGEKAIVKGSTALAKGRFRATTEDTAINEDVYVNYKDILNNVQIVLCESKLAPLSRIKVNLPNPEKYNVPEFFVTGHFEIKHINVLNLKKTVQGGPIMKELAAGKKVNLLNKVFMEKMGEPLLILDTVETSIGSIQQIRNKSTIEI